MMKRTMGAPAILLASALVLLSFREVQAAAPTQGLVGHWRFDEGSGAGASDSSGNNNDGVISGVGAAWTGGRTGGGLSFNGSSGVVTVPSSSSINLTGAFTLSAWVRPSALSGYQTILHKGATAGCSYWLQTGGAQASSGLSASPTCGSYSEHLASATLTVDTWSHFAAVYDSVARTYKLFLNGALILSQAEAGLPAPISQALVFGQSSCSSCSYERWRGVLDEIRVYNRALSNQEVLDIYDDLGSPLPPDTQPPSVPSALAATPASSTQVDLSWDASTDNVGVVGYHAYRNGALISTTSATTLADPGLSASTTYSYVVDAFDGAGNQSAASPSVSATTFPPSTDNEAPSVSLTAPVNGAIVSGATVTVSATASDNVGVTAVQFLRDGQPLGSPDTAAPFGVTWDTAAAASGSHTLSATASDVAGNQGSAGVVTVMVDNLPPTGSVMVNDGASATNQRSVSLKLSATDGQTAVILMRFSNTGGSYSAGEAFVASKPWTLSTGSGIKTVYAQFSDAAGNWSLPTTDTIILDTSRPRLSSIAVGSLTASSATVSWVTNEPATSKVDYGQTAAYGQGTPFDPTLVTVHAGVLTGLKPATLYNYRVRSFDAAGNERVSTNHTFTTADSADTTPPTVTLTQPSPGAVVSGSVTLAATAADDRDVAGVQFLIDSQPQGAQDVVSPYTIVWDTASVTSEVHVVSAVATDTSGNQTTSAPVTVTVSNSADSEAPSIPDGVVAAAPSTGSIVVTWDASTDNVAVTGYRVYRDGGLLSSVAETKYVDFGLAPSTTHAYAVAAYDEAGNVSSPSSLASSTTQAPVAFSYPLKLSSDRRSLVDQNGRPFMVNGEAAWSLFAQLSQEDAELYLENRRQKGFNMVLASLIEHQFATNAPANIYGVEPFLRPGDFGTPNEPYFANADVVIDKAAQKGIVVLLAPLYLGYDCGWEGWCNEVARSSPATMRSWGRYVGNRYRDHPNIVWVIGGDADPVANGVGDQVKEFVAGLREYDTQHLITAHNAPEEAARDPWPNETWLTLNSTYTYLNTHVAAAANYVATPIMPFFLMESSYENEHGSTPLSLRAQAYWTVLSGGLAGHVFGNCQIWSFSTGNCTTAWKPQLESAGSRTLALVGKLFATRPFGQLVPDRNHVVLTNGYQSGSTYATTARASDGSTIVAYIPTQRVVTIDMSKVSGTLADVWWYDPRTGGVALAGSFPTVGMRSFTPPASGDWVLVIDDFALVLPAPGS